MSIKRPHFVLSLVRGSGEIYVDSGIYYSESRDEAIARYGRDLRRVYPNLDIHVSEMTMSTAQLRGLYETLQRMKEEGLL
jgi:aspartate aminotransferase-like enzyme